MNKKICIQEDKILFYVLIIILIIFIIFFIFYQYTMTKMNDENEKSQIILSNKISNLENNVKKSKEVCLKTDSHNS